MYNLKQDTNPDHDDPDFFILVYSGIENTIQIEKSPEQSTNYIDPYFSLFHTF